MIVATALDAVGLFRPCFVDADEEALAVAHLGEGKRLIELAVIARGAPDGVDLPMRRIFADALRLGATGLMIAHNHPGGDPRPSREDVEATRALAATGERLGVRLLDHLILARGATCSLRALGFL